MPKTCSCIQYLIVATKLIPVLLTTAIFGWGWYVYIFQLVLLSLQKISQQVVYSLIFHILYIFSLWSYLKTIFTSSGQIPQQFYLPAEVAEDLNRTSAEHEKDEILVYYVKRNNLPVSCRAYSGGIRLCEKCNLIKPDRCHHCSICGVCVLKMDHHCPWINNCVSFANYKFFVLFLGYTFALCVFVGCTTFPYTVNFWKVAEELTGTNTTGITNQSHVPFNVRFQILFLFFITTMLSLGIVFLFGYHIYLLLRNQSTLEAFRAPIMTHGPDKNAFNLGAKKNLLQLFGRNSLLWLVPIFTSEGNGLSYDQRSLMGLGDEELRQEKL